ncbi:MAG: hypothetical protein LC746_12320 [Acidobacteria bacterium]|nr:hypothetical protein [Acidobacteriota bacterium]
MTRSVVALFALLLLAAASAAQTPERARQLLAEVDKIEAALGDGDAAHAAKLAARLYERARALPAGDLRTDLVAAAQNYRSASAPRPAPRAESQPVSCERERPGAYRRLCASLPTRDAAPLALAKARLHARFALASADSLAGAPAAQTAAALGEMRAERVLDLVLARQALVALGELESLTNAPATLADFEQEKKVGNVTPSEFSTKLDEASRTVRQSLAWLPESELRSEIDNARQSYADALWWWQRSDRPPVVKVTAGAFAEQNFAAMSRLPDTVLGYNAVANVRHARDCSRRAGARLDAALGGAGFADAKPGEGR